MRPGPPNMAKVVGRYAFDVVRRRWAALTQTAEGLPTSALASSDTIRMFAAPASGKVIERLPEGYERRQILEGYTTADLTLGDESTGQRADSILVFGGEFEVIEIRNWAGGPAGAVTWRSCVLAEVQR